MEYAMRKQKIAGFLREAFAGLVICMEVSAYPMEYKPASNRPAPAAVLPVKRFTSVKKPPFFMRRWFVWFMGLSFAFVLMGMVALAIFLKPFKDMAETFDLGQVSELEKASSIYDRKGRELGRIFVENRRLITIDKISQNFIHALMSAEDQHFMEHDGVDYIGLVRAVYLNTKAGQVNQGASTITQQLAKQTYGIAKRTYGSKLTEMFLAQRLEKAYTKAQILGFYLNRIYFGSGFYGLEAAAQGYYGKAASDLTIEESASIAGLIKSPVRISPFNSVEECKKSRNNVLRRMLEDKFITEEQWAEYTAMPIHAVRSNKTQREGYVYEEVVKQAMEKVGEEEAVRGGFQIYTTIDLDLQKVAEESLSRHLANQEKVPGYQAETPAAYRAVLQEFERSRKSGSVPDKAEPPAPKYLQGAVLMLDNRDGGVICMVGGRDYRESSLNRAIHRNVKRPVGSAFLPFLYASAFAVKNLTPVTQLLDAPMDSNRIGFGGSGWLGEWGSEAAQSSYEGKISSRTALVRSRNAASVQLGEMVGYSALKDVCAKAGINSKLNESPNTYLGASEARLDEMCLAYSVFPNGGSRPQDSYIIQRIDDSDGHTVYTHSKEVKPMEAAMDSATAFQIHTCLEECLTEGTASRATTELGLKNFASGGKTGTSYDSRDLWFFGYSRRLTCGVWMGHDTPRRIGNGTFSNEAALPVWVDIMNSAMKTEEELAAHEAPDYPDEDIEQPATVVEVECCERSGMRALEVCYDVIRGQGFIRNVPTTYSEFFRAGSELPGYCKVHAGKNMPGTDKYIPPAHVTSNDLNSSSSVTTIPNYPVRMKSSPLIGTDPYGTALPDPAALAPVVVMRPREPKIVKEPKKTAKTSRTGRKGESKDEAAAMAAIPPKPVIVSEFDISDTRIRLEAPPPLQLE